METNLNNFIEELIQEIEKELDEATTSGNVAGYNTPAAFSDKSAKDKKRKKKISTQFGMKIVGKIDEDDINEGMTSPSRGHEYFQITKDTPIKYIKSQSNPLNAPGVLLHNKDGYIKGKKGAYLIDYHGALFYVDIKNKFASKAYPMRDQNNLNYNSNFKEVDKAPQMSDWKKYLKEDINEGPMDKIFGGIPYTKKGKQSMATVWLPDDVKELIIKRAKKAGKVAKPNNGGGVTVFESVNEAKVKRPVNRWLELKNDETMHPHKKMAMGLKELKYQLRETEKFFNWYNKIKTMNELDSNQYWKRTNSHIYKIKERLINIAKTIQEIEK